jgi:ketosteroid isomerase-like protein
MDIKSFLSDWIEVSNSYNTEKYLEKYLKEAVLDDPSAGKKFVGHEGIKDYYTSYFIGYKTQTTITKLEINNDTAYMEVEFTGEFPGGKIGGMFDFKFKDGKIHKVIADLL